MVSSRARSHAFNPSIHIIIKKHSRSLTPPFLPFQAPSQTTTTATAANPAATPTPLLQTLSNLPAPDFGGAAVLLELGGGGGALELELGAAEEEEAEVVGAAELVVVIIVVCVAVPVVVVAVSVAEGIVVSLMMAVPTDVFEISEEIACRAEEIALVAVAESALESGFSDAAETAVEAPFATAEETLWMEAEIERRGTMGMGRWVGMLSIVVATELATEAMFDAAEAGAEAATVVAEPATLDATIAS